MSDTRLKLHKRNSAAYVIHWRHTRLKTSGQGTKRFTYQAAIDICEAAHMLAPSIEYEPIKIDDSNR